MAFGYVLFARNMRFAGVDWGQYQRDAVTNTDFRKFDDTLRQIISGTSRQSRELTEYLERRYEQGKLVFGMYRSPAALMTCRIFSRHGAHVHFVDGVDGGYALVAARMKERLEQSKPIDARDDFSDRP